MWRTTQGLQGFFIAWSAEKANELDSDIFVTWVPDSGTKDAIKADPLLGQIPAVKNGALVADSDNTLTLSISASSPLSLPWALDKFLPQLAGAADKVAAREVHASMTNVRRRRPPRRWRPAPLPRPPPGRSRPPRRPPGCWSPSSCLCLVCAASLAVGARGVPLGTVWQALTHFDPANGDHAVVHSRIPRTVPGLLVGGCAGPGRRGHAGRGPQPAGRPRHPGRQRRAACWPS